MLCIYCVIDKIELSMFQIHTRSRCNFC